MVSYLHRITRDKENEPQNDLIREFSLQVIHEQIAITANGFFNIDYDLLGAVSCLCVQFFLMDFLIKILLQI